MTDQDRSSVVPEYMPQRDIAAVVAQSLISIALLILYWRSPVGFFLTCSEGAVVESLTSSLFLVGAALAAVASVRMFRGTDRRTLIATGIAFLALGLFVAGMEEISWGQQVFGWKTPAALAKLNNQQELNLHNVATGLSEKASLAASLLFGVAVPFVLLVSPALRRFYEDRVGLVPPGPAALLCCMLGYAWFNSNWRLPSINLVVSVAFSGALLVAGLRSALRGGRWSLFWVTCVALLVSVATRMALRTNSPDRGPEVAEQALALAAFLIAASTLQRAPERDGMGAPARGPES